MRQKQKTLSLSILKGKYSLLKFHFGVIYISVKEDTKIILKGCTFLWCGEYRWTLFHFVRVLDLCFLIHIQLLDTPSLSRRVLRLLYSYLIPNWSKYIIYDVLFQYIHTCEFGQLYYAYIGYIGFIGTMHILEDFSRTDNSLYKCHKKYFQLVKKNMKGKNEAQAQKCKKMGIFSKYFFENQQILSYRSIFFYLFFFSLLKNMI